MLTIEFKLTLTAHQQFLIDRWLEQLRIVWNRSVSELLHFDEFHKKYTDTIDGKKQTVYAPRCPVLWNYRTVYLDKSGAATNKDNADSRITVSYSDLLDTRAQYYQKKLTRVRIPCKAEKKNEWGWKAPQDSYGCNGYSCPVPQDYKPALIDNPSTFGLCEVIKADNIGAALDAIALRQSQQHDTQVPRVPYKYMQGYIGQLGTSWQEYEKSRYKQNSLNRGKPRFKKESDGVGTLIFCNSQNKSVRPVVVAEDKRDRLSGIPGLKVVKCKGLSDRWKDENNNTPDIRVLKITKRPSGYYIQLTGLIAKKQKLSKKDRAVGIDPGVNKLLSFDNGKYYDNPKFIRRSEKHRIKLEKQLAAKRIHRLILWLNHSDRTASEVRVICPAISESAANMLLTSKPKNEADIQRHISASSMNTLKFKAFPESKRTAKLEQQISKKHERVRLQRRHLDHKISTYVVRTYSHIAIEGTQLKNLTKTAKPKIKADGNGYDRNNASAKSGLNKSILDASFGRKRALIEQKAKTHGREYYEIPAAYTSQTCPVCGKRDKPDSDRIFRCACGWECDRDTNAGINMILQVYDVGAVKLESLSDMARKALDARMAWCANHKPVENHRKRKRKSDSDNRAP